VQRVHGEDPRHERDLSEPEGSRRRAVPLRLRRQRVRGREPERDLRIEGGRAVRKQQILYPALFDTAQTKVSTQFGDADFPNLFLLDSDGTVVASWNSEGGYEQFMAKARKYLGFAL